MSDTLPRFLYSDEDWDLWEEKLMNCEKEDIVELMLMRMSNDTRFFNLVYAKFGNGNETDEEVDAQIQFYESDIYREMYEKNPDIDYIISVTERFFITIEEMPGILHKVRGYIAIINKLDQSINQGVGYKNDDDWLLVDRIEDAKKYLVNLIEKEAKAPSIKTQIKNRILQSMESYDPVGENYLQMVLDEMKKMDE